MRKVDNFFVIKERESNMNGIMIDAADRDGRNCIGGTRKKNNDDDTDDRYNNYNTDE